MKVLCFIIVSLSLCHSHALDYRLCQETPNEKHCLIEYSVRYKWPHQVRYVFNWYTMNCFEIRWSEHCRPVPTPPLTNNFSSEQECLSECGGWA